MNQATYYQEIIGQFDTFNKSVTDLVRSVISSHRWENPTVWIAIAVAIIAFMQWRTAEKKRKQELFDKRYFFYNNVFQLFYQKQTQNKNVTVEDLLPYANEAMFLFDKKLSDHVMSIMQYSKKDLNYDWFNKPFLKYLKMK